MDLTSAGLPEPDRTLAAILHQPGLLAQTPEQSRDSLLEAAEHHGVAGLLLHRLATSSEPALASWDHLRRLAARQSAAAALRDGEALAVLRRAAGAGLPLVVIKGLALAYTVYPHPWIRERSDTDLLVREDDLPRFDRLFGELGYTLLPHVRGALTLPQCHYYKDDAHGFRHAWDLHWRLTSSQALRDTLDERAVRARAEEIASLAGARVPSRADALLLACVHRLAHHFDDRRLIWLWDIRLLLEQMNEVDINLFVQMAARPASAAACARSLQVAQELTGATLPNALVAVVDTPADGGAAFLWSQSRRPITYLVGELRAARPRDRARLLRERVLPSLSSMRERYPSVPTALLPFAYVWRLAAGIPKWVRRR